MVAVSARPAQQIVVECRPDLHSVPTWHDVLKALKASSLSANCRHVMRELADWADEEKDPSLAEIAEATALGVSTVKRSLNTLESEGWIVRNRPSYRDARAGHTTSYLLRIPGGRTMAADRPQPQSRATQLGPQRAPSAPRIPSEPHPRRRSSAPSVGPQWTGSSKTLKNNNHPSDGCLFDLEPAQTPPPENPVSQAVAAYVKAVIETGRRRPAGAILARVGKQAKTILAEGNYPAEMVIEAAAHLGASGYLSLAQQLLFDDKKAAQESARIERNYVAPWESSSIPYQSSWKPEPVDRRFAL